MNYTRLKKTELIEVIKMNNCSIEQLNKEIQEHKITINSLKQDKEHLTHIINARDNEISDLKDIITSLNNDIDYQRNIMAKREKKHNEDLNAIESFKSSNADLFNKWRTADAQVEVYKNDFDKATLTIKDKLQIIKKLKKENIIYKISLIVFLTIMLFTIVWC